MPSKPTCYDFILAHVGHKGEGCLKWPFNRDQHGRGLLKVKQRTWWAHRLMCTLAHGEPPTPKHTAAHSCGKGHEGCIHPEHLSWKTQKENLADCIAHGTAVRTTYGPGGVLKPHQVQEIREARGVETQRSLAERFGVSEGAINDIWRGRTHARPTKNPLWTDEEAAKLLESIERGYTRAQTAEYVGKSLAAIHSRLHRTRHLRPAD